jgi:Na+-transporting methylmalonyl-CoA/oxaloacetate decarboxylase gamma subunit
MWLIILIVIVAVFLMMRRKPAVDSERSHSPAVHKEDVPVSPAAARTESEDDELLVVFAAAVSEFEGTEGFKAVRIKPAKEGWRLTARQELLHNRL